MSRSGKEFKFTLPSVVEYKFKSLCNEMSIYSAPYVMHGEFLVLKDDGTFEERTVGNGYLNSDNVDPNKVCFVCWDNILLEQYNEGYSSIPYHIRDKFTSRIVGIIDSPHVQKVEQVVCNTTEELVNHFVECRSKGLEGTVVKQFEMPWKDHKTKLGLKLKNQFDCEYVVTGVQEHSKKKNQVGALFVESSCGKVKFKVGSGLTDKQRKDFWLTRDDLIGKIVTVRGNDLVSSESKDTYSIFLPRLIEVRVDKSEADDYDKVIESKDSILELLKQIK